MRRQARIANRDDLRVSLEKLRQNKGVEAHPRVANFQRFETAMYQPGFMRTRHRSGDFAPIAHGADY